MANDVLKRKPRPPRAGLGPGPMKTTKVLKEAILEAAERMGNLSDTNFRAQGKDGLIGYLMHLGITEPKSFATLLGRVLPMQITGEGGGPIRMIDDRMSPKEAAEAYADTLRNIDGVIDAVENIDLDPGDYTVVGEEEPR